MLGGCRALPGLGEPPSGPVVTAEDAIAAVQRHQRRKGIDPAQEKLSAKKDASGDTWWVVSWHIFKGSEEASDGRAGFSPGGHTTYEVSAEGKILNENTGI